MKTSIIIGAMLLAGCAGIQSQVQTQHALDGEKAEKFMDGLHLYPSVPAEALKTWTPEQITEYVKAVASAMSNLSSLVLNVGIHQEQGTEGSAKGDLQAKLKAMVAKELSSSETEGETSIEEVP